jgi:Uma2 family endonuclease
MTTVILGEHPEVQAMIEQRRALGQDGSDEVWEGVYYVVSHAHASHALLQTRLGRQLEDLTLARGFEVTGEFNLGEPNDFRVPDLGIHRDEPDVLYVPTAAMVVEILSPDGKTYKKFDFYSRHDVEEILVVDPADRSVQLWLYDSSLASYRQNDNSAILGTSRTELESTIRWPRSTRS